MGGNSSVQLDKYFDVSGDESDKSFGEQSESSSEDSDVEMFRNQGQATTAVGFSFM